ncbi:MAG: hypothetical protein PHI45_00630 [Candidatus Pacebacteria bacterium]|nr:hypothetical protein [Candidatus Paceibacterota bacterium]MDD5013012.1 hypothetical protein [Candidatus Paceibacterota bacterium]MDD5752584.1 hypothetical protein [Candidatus Paceibacterota bacterium]
MFTHDVTKDEKAKQLVEENRLYEAARYCFYVDIPTKTMIMVIEEFIKKRKIKIETKSLFLLKKQTLRYLLCCCINTEKRESIPKITIIKKKNYKTITF